MQEKDVQFKCLFEEMVDLKNKVKNKDYFEKLKKQEIKYPLWWEGIVNIR